MRGRSGVDILLRFESAHVQNHRQSIDFVYIFICLCALCLQYFTLNRNRINRRRCLDGELGKSASETVSTHSGYRPQPLMIYLENAKHPSLMMRRQKNMKSHGGGNFLDARTRKEHRPGGATQSRYRYLDIRYPSILSMV